MQINVSVAATDPEPMPVRRAIVLALDLHYNGVFVDIVAGQVVVSGNTYYYKDLLKKWGYKWNAASKAWTRPAEGFKRIVPYRQPGQKVHFSIE